MYKNKTYMTEGFTHGCYWKSSGKIEFYADNLIHQSNFGANMNHHHYTNNTNSSSSGVPYSDSGGGGHMGRAGGRGAGAGSSDMDPYYSTGSKSAGRSSEMLVGGASSDMLSSYSSYNPATYQQPSGSTSGLNSAMGTGRKLPNVESRNGKRQLPNVQGRSSSSLGSSDYRVATQSPVSRRLPVPQRSMKTAGAAGGPQSSLIDNFNIDLSVKVRSQYFRCTDESH